MIKRSIKYYSYSYSLFVLALLITGKYKISKSLFMQDDCNYLQSFTNIRKENSVCVEKMFKKNLKKLYQTNNAYKQIKVLILGTLNDPRFKFSNHREVELYNEVIKKIVKLFKLSNEEVWYKHHPRLDLESWKYKKNNLKCSIFDYNCNSLAEIELLNKNLLAIYSSLSTSILYSKKIFNLDTYLIDFRNEGGHPSAYKKAYYLAKKYKIPVVTVG